MKEKTKKITINKYCVRRGMDKTIKASSRRYELDKLHKISFLRERNIYENVINTYMNCNNLPIKWNNFF